MISFCWAARVYFENERTTMKALRFWLPTLIGLLITPLFLISLSDTISPKADHAGAGMGQLLVLYPVPLLAMMFAPRLPALGALWLQFPVYGFIISYANLRKSIWLKVLAGMVWFHLIAITGFVVVLAIQAVL